jgi:hypothetical protein
LAGNKACNALSTAQKEERVVSVTQIIPESQWVRIPAQARQLAVWLSVFVAKFQPFRLLTSPYYEQ